MLSMKTLRVAIVTMGSALLLGSGLAAATVQKLDGTGDDAAKAISYAAETLTMVPVGRQHTAPPSTRSTHFGLSSPRDHDGDGDEETTAHQNHKLVVTPSRQVDAAQGGTETLYLRLTLGGGMVFAPNAAGGDGNATAAVPSWMQGSDPMSSGNTLNTETIAGGAQGQNFVVYRVNSVIPLNDGTDSTNAPLKNHIWIDVFDDLAVPAGAGEYTARISAHKTPDDAVDGVAAVSSIAGHATIVTVASGVHAEVKAGDAATADVGTRPEPFLWFKDGNSVKNSAALGSATATARVAAGVINAMTGNLVVPSELLADGSITLTVEGDFSIGAFDLLPMSAAIVDEDPNDGDDDSMPAMVQCPAPGAADAPEPVMGNVNKATSEENPMTATIGMQNAGTYHLCVQVDVQGPNATPIPATSYMGAITHTSSPGMSNELAAGTIGEIKRNGTTVQVAYLTKSEKYNQRLIIVNRGPVPARFDIGGFTPEVGSDTTVELSAAAQAARDAGLNVIPAGGQVVLRVADLLSFTGDMRRTGATISINADVRNIQVATTQVNREDGSTDTVVYASEDGARIQ